MADRVNKSRHGMIEALVFDLGNVLVHFSHERMCRQMGSVCGISPDEMRRLLFDAAVQSEFERGLLTEQAFHGRLERQLARSLDFEALVHAASDIFEPNPEIVPLIDALRAQGRRLVLLSNTSVSHFRFVQKNFPVLERFDAHVVSFKVGATKPDRAMFEAAIAAAGCPAPRCFYTDDIPEYVAAGRRHGLQAELYTGVESLRQQLRKRGVELPGGGSTFPKSDVRGQQ
jgi:putative hydrolase of the HAD superfamily